MNKVKRGRPVTLTEPKACAYCGDSFNRKFFASKPEDIRIYLNRKYCSRRCSDEATKKRARDNYAVNAEKARESKKITMRRLRESNPEKYNEQSRQAKIREKLKLFLMYGRFCAMCGFDDLRALSLDHKNNDGNEERRLFGERGVYRKAKAEYRPDLYQVLCMNCQFIKRVIHAGHIDLNQEWLRLHGESSGIEAAA